MTLHPFRAVALALLAACLAAAAPAQGAYPLERATLVTHSAPGGGSDVFLRELARYLGPALRELLALVEGLPDAPRVDLRALRCA